MCLANVDGLHLNQFKRQTHVAMAEGTWLQQVPKNRKYGVIGYGILQGYRTVELHSQQSS